MKSRRRCVLLFFAIIAGCSTGVVAAPQPKPAPQASAVTVRKVTYDGWPNSLLMSNGVVEVVIVPAIGRVMQFRFVGEETGAFWENRALDGKPPDPASTE